MSKGQRGNKEAKKPKKALDTAPAQAPGGTAPTVVAARPGRTPQKR